MKESQKVAKAKYDKKAMTKFVFQFNRKTDADIIERLEEVGNKQGYIKEIIRKDLENGI